MFRLSNARMPKIKTRAVAAKQSAPSIDPEPRVPIGTNLKTKLKLIQGGRSEGARKFGKRDFCTFCKNELKIQEEDALMEWRRGVAYALGHKNPDMQGLKDIVQEDIMRELNTGTCFHYLGDKHYK